MADQALARAMFDGPSSPVTQTFGLGLSEPEAPLILEAATRRSGLEQFVTAARLTSAAVDSDIAIRTARTATATVTRIRTDMVIPITRSDTTRTIIITAITRTLPATIMVGRVTALTRMDQL